LNADDKEFATRTPFVFIGNNEYEMEGFNIGRRARLDAGVLSLYVTRRVGRLGLLRLALRALFKRLRQAKDFVAMRTSEVWVETRRKRIRVAIDGEVALMQSPLHYRVHPRALRVVIPKTEPSE
jgi:diacylglycerol kinase family enzyme